jgi:hypothetical protein
VLYDAHFPETVFGAQVRALREEIGLPLASLAAAAQDQTGTAMTAGELALSASGQHPVRLNEAVALAGVMDMTVEEMLRRDASGDPRPRDSRLCETRLHNHSRHRRI